MESDEETVVGSSPFVEDAIEIYLRVKPVANPTKKVEYDAAEGKARARAPPGRRTRAVQPRERVCGDERGGLTDWLHSARLSSTCPATPSGGS